MSHCLLSLQPALGFHRSMHAPKLLFSSTDDWAFEMHAAVAGLSLKDTVLSVQRDDSLLLQASLACAWTFVTGCIILAVLCFLHEWRCARAAALMTDDGPSEELSREHGWDIVRFVIVCCIVSTHLDVLVRCENAYDAYVMWNTSSKDAVNPSNGTLFSAACQTRTHTSFICHSAAYIMPSFAFVSGVLGQKADPGTLAKLVFCIAGSSFFVGWLVQMAQGFHRPFHWEANWYVWDLLHWRLFLSPMFLAAKNCRVPLVLPFGVVALSTYFMFEGALPALPRLPYLPFFYNPARQNLAPFFALGQLLSPTAWANLLRSWWLRALACFVLVAWYVAHLLSPWLRSSNDLAGFGKVVGNLSTERAIDNSYWPQPTHAVTLTSLLNFLLIFGLKLAIAFAFVWTVAALAPLLRGASLQLSIAVSGFGDRSLHGYLLHWPLLLLGKRFGLGRVLDAVPENEYLCLNICLSGLIGFMCCCRLTEGLLTHLVTPCWIIDVALRSKRAIRQLAGPSKEPSAGGGTTGSAEPLAKAPRLGD